MNQSHICENCKEEIYSGYLFDMSEYGLGIVCEECFLDYWMEELSGDEWDRLYQGSAKKMADLVDVMCWDIEQYLNDYYSTMIEDKYRD